VPIYAGKLTITDPTAYGASTPPHSAHTSGGSLQRECGLAGPGIQGHIDRCRAALDAEDAIAMAASAGQEELFLAYREANRPPYWEVKRPPRSEEAQRREEKCAQQRAERNGKRILTALEFLHIMVAG
jgi:hypothetical protein